MGAVVRATLGHIVASKLVIDASSPDVAMRSYLLNNKPLDADMRVQFWHYPYDDMSIARDFVVTDLQNKVKTGILSVIKFRPIALCASFDGPQLNCPDITQYASLDPTTEVSVHISIADTYASLWPEHASIVNPYHALTVGAAFVESGVETRATETPNQIAPHV